MLPIQTAGRFRYAQGQIERIGDRWSHRCTIRTTICDDYDPLSNPSAPSLSRQTQLDGNATVTLIDSDVRGNRAQSGGAIHVNGGAMMRIEQSRITDNTAEVSGGALQVTPQPSR